MSDGTPNASGLQVGKILPPAGRGRVARFKAGTIEAIDVSKELIAGPTRIDAGGAVIKHQKRPVEGK